LEQITAKISSVYSSGLTKISFSHLLDVPPKLSEIDESVLNVKIIPGADSDALSNGFTWKLSAFTDSDLTIQLAFDDPLSISKHDVIHNIISHYFNRAGTKCK
jgi:hypothetical protein